MKEIASWNQFSWLEVEKSGGRSEAYIVAATAAANKGVKMEFSEKLELLFLLFFFEIQEAV